MKLPEELSVHAIRVELHRRGLSTSGLKSELRLRLAASLQCDDSGELTVPTRFQRAVSSPSKSRKRRRTSGGDSLDDDININIDIEPAKGYWMGRCVWVTATDGMDTLWTVSDSYGKGNLSRSQPIYSRAGGEGRHGKAARQLHELEKTAANKCGTVGKSAGVNGACGDTVVRRDGVEHLQLTLFEAYHAAFVTRRLNLYNYTGESLGSDNEVWEIFACKDARFPALFGLYSRYRDTGWIPRSGLKYGVDLVLYKKGNHKHTHSPYCVIISDTPYLENTWIRLQNKLRLVKNVAKSLIVAAVSFDNPPRTWEEAISHISISEITVDRWVA